MGGTDIIVTIGRFDRTGPSNINCVLLHIPCVATGGKEACCLQLPLPNLFYVQILNSALLTNTLMALLWHSDQLCYYGLL